jgi:pyruvate/2-oxoglutarate dehydrogenase complex dihydrolipoamide acyltransferase (E2) component
MQVPKILSPPTEATLPKVQKASAATPKRRRMANVLDVVLETMKVFSPAATKKVAETTKTQAEAKTRQAETEAAQAQTEAEAGPSVPTEMEPSNPKEKTTERIASEKIEAPAPEALNKSTDYIICHALGKELSQEEMLETRHYAQKLKYPKGALVFNGSNEEDFLYCLPDNKEISVSQEISKSIGFPKLKDDF